MRIYTLSSFISKSKHEYIFINGQHKCENGNMWYSERFKVGESEYKLGIIKPTLEHVVKDDRIKHAILFSGYSFTNVKQDCKILVITVYKTILLIQSIILYILIIKHTFIIMVTKW